MTWNVGRSAERKTAAIERLIKDCRRPAFIALQEVGKASADASELAGACVQHKYVAFVTHRQEDTAGHGGAALLVRDDIAAQQWEWKEADAWHKECESVSVRVTPRFGPPFIVTSWYVHGGSKDTDGFRRVLFSARSD